MVNTSQWHQPVKMRDFASTWNSSHSSLGCRIFPGFIRFFGSRASFRTCMTWMLVSPISSHSSAFFPKPTPCSPVHVPAMARARLVGTQTRLFCSNTFCLDYFLKMKLHKELKLITLIISATICSPHSMNTNTYAFYLMQNVHSAAWLEPLETCSVRQLELLLHTWHTPLTHQK